MHVCYQIHYIISRWYRKACRESWSNRHSKECWECLWYNEGKLCTLQYGNDILMVIFFCRFIYINKQMHRTKIGQGGKNYLILCASRARNSAPPGLDSSGWGSFPPWEFQPGEIPPFSPSSKLMSTKHFYLLKTQIF